MQGKQALAADRGAAPGLIESARVALAAWLGAEASTAQIEPLGEGHINETLRVSTSSQHYVLQRVSTTVFTEPAAVMANQQLLADCAARAEDWAYALPVALPTPGGERLVTVQTAGHWRLSDYIGESRTLQSLQSVAQASAAGRAFGDFQRLVRTIPADEVRPVIAGFHNVTAYLAQLGAAHAASADEDRQALDLCHELFSRESTYSENDAHTAAVIHGDCKVNNLLFAQDADRVIALLDLDTLMVGPWWLDFGDLVRSACFDSNGSFQADLYGAIAQGFVSGHQALAASQLEPALRAPAHLAYMLTMRFLADHMMGDQYFNVERRGDNLQRANQQFAALQALESAAIRQQMRRALERAMEVD